MSSSRAVRETAWPFMYGVGENTTGRYSSTKAPRYPRFIFYFSESVAATYVNFREKMRLGRRRLPDAAVDFLSSLSNLSDTIQLSKSTPDRKEFTASSRHNHIQPRVCACIVRHWPRPGSANARTCCLPVQSCSSIFLRFDPRIRSPSS